MAILKMLEFGTLPMNLNSVLVSVMSAIVGLITGPVLMAIDDSDTPTVPQTLLKLVHTPEVQEELGFKPNDERLLAILRELDSRWWPSRNLAEDKQRVIVEELDGKLLASLKLLLPDDKIRRLHEIELQSQGTRALLRNEIAAEIGIDAQQSQDFLRMSLETDTIARTLSSKKGNDVAAEKQLIAAREAEQRKFLELLTNSQRTTLMKLIGKPFDTMKLKRVLPLAPELIDSGEWAGGSPTTLYEQRGKVVLLHFYAFQCHNCVANFNHYTRWHDKLSSKGVSVIGIQTPETSAERDATQVKKAAIARGFRFPVLIDLKSKNWDAWGNTMWPSVYVIDKNGYIRSWWQGELNWQGATGDKTIEKLIDELLAES